MSLLAGSDTGCLPSVHASSPWAGPAKSVRVAAGCRLGAALEPGFAPTRLGWSPPLLAWAVSAMPLRTAGALRGPTRESGGPAFAPAGRMALVFEAGVRSCSLGRPLIITREPDVAPWRRGCLVKALLAVDKGQDWLDARAAKSWQLGERSGLSEVGLAARAARVSTLRGGVVLGAVSENAGCATSGSVVRATTANVAVDAVPAVVMV